MKFKIYFLFFALSILSILAFENNSVKDDKVKIGILQLVQHDALDESRLGFIDGLKEKGLINKKNISLFYENAQGDQSNCYLLANKLINKDVNLILAIATPSAQAVASQTKEIPIIVTAITSPKSAGLVKSNEKPDTNVTGTSDLAPVEKQIKLIKQLKPESKKIGILYCSNEANSGYQATLAQNEIKKLGMTSKIFTVSQSSEVSQVAENMVRSVDAIYTPTDNMMASTMPTISSIATQKGIPIVCGETNVVNKGAVGTYGMDYYKLGKLAASEAYEILINNKKPQNMPIEYLKDNQLTLNKNILNKLNINVPEELKKKATFIN